MIRSLFNQMDQASAKIVFLLRLHTKSHNFIYFNISAVSTRLLFYISFHKQIVSTFQPSYHLQPLFSNIMFCLLLVSFHLLQHSSTNSFYMLERTQYLTFISFILFVSNFFLHIFYCFVFYSPSGSLVVLLFFRYFCFKQKCFLLL